jgi:hypothetical protein
MLSARLELQPTPRTRHPSRTQVGADPPVPAATEVDDATPRTVRPPRGAHIIAPCPHDGMYPLAVHLLPRRGRSKPGSAARPFKSSDADTNGPRAGGGVQSTTGMPFKKPLCTFTQRCSGPFLCRKPSTPPEERTCVCV